MNKNIYIQGDYLKINPTWHSEDSKWKAIKIEKILNKNGIRPKSVAEVGCGAGEILNRLSITMDGSTTFTGYEISPQAFDICKKIRNKRINFYLKNILKEKDIFFDVLLCIDVIEHIEDYFNFLRALKTKGNYKIFHIPLDLSVLTVMRSSPLLRVRNRLGHLHYFNKEIAIEILNDAGYRILDYFYTSGSTELPSKSFKSSLTKFPRKILFKINKDIAVRILGRYSILLLTV